MGKDKIHPWSFRWPAIECFMLMLVGISLTVAEGGPYHGTPSSEDVFLDGLDSVLLSTINDLHSYTEQLLEAAEVDMIKSFMAEHTRIRRSIANMNSMMLDVNASGTVEFPRMVQWFVKLQTPTGLFVVVFTDDPALELYEVLNGQYRIISQIPVADAEWNDGVQHIVIATAFVTETNIWVVWCTKSYKVYAYCFSHDPDANVVVVHKQFIVEHMGITALKLFQVDYQLCLIIATDSAGISSYYLNVNYFDKKEQSTLDINGVTSVETFEMHKQTYLLLISSNYKQGIGLCNFNSGKMECTRPIDLPHVTRATHYVDMHYLEDHTLQNHYIIFTSSAGNHSIYYVSHGKLLFWQQLAGNRDEYLAEEDTNTSAAVIRTPQQEIIICIASGQKVLLYVEDKDAEFQLDYTLTVPAVVTDVSFDYVLGQGIQLYVLYGGTVPSIGIWKVLTVDRQPKQDNLIDCLESLDSALTAREDDLSTLKSYVEEKKVMRNSGNQIWDQSVYIQSLEVKNTVNLKNVAVTRSEEETSLYDLTEEVKLMMIEVEDLQKQAEMLLLYTGSQTFETPLNISVVTASRAEVNTVHITYMNGIPLAHLDEAVLLQDIRQTVNTPITFYKLEAASLETELGNDVTFSGTASRDFVQDDLDQELQGFYRFANVLVGNAIGLDSNHLAINDIPTDIIIVPGSDPVLINYKRLSNLAVVERTTFNKLNNITFENMVEEMVITNSEEPASLEGNVIFLGILKASRNLDVSSLKFYNFSALYYTAVKTYGINVVRGSVVMAAKLVGEDCSAERVNGISWHAIVLESHDCITPSFVADQIHILRDVEVGLLNNITLHDEVALDGLNTVIDGRIEFRGPVAVEKSFTMEVNATIGGMDPVDLVILRNITTLLVNNSTTFEDNLNISGDLEAPVVNDINLPSLQETFWSKTLPQKIDHTLYLTEAVFRSNVQVGTLNAYFASDYLQLEKYQDVMGYYYFQKRMTVDNILMLKDVLMDQVDVSEISNNVLTVDGTQTIFTGMNFLDGLIVKTEMNLTSLNGIHTDDFMLLDGDQKHKGTLTVENASVVLLYSNSDAWIQATINGYNLELALGNIYDRNRSGAVTSYVKVNELKVNKIISEGLIDNVDFNSVMQRSVKTTAPKQYVTTDLTVDHFRTQGWFSIDKISGQNFMKYTIDVVQRTGLGHILGTKRFHEVNEVVQELNAGRINRRNVILEASRMMRKTTNQHIPVYLAFEAVTIGYLRAEMVDTVNLSHILYTDLYLEVGNLELNKAVFTGNLGAPHDILDDCDVGKLLKLLEWLNEGGAVIVETRVLADHLLVLGNVSTSVDLVAFGKKSELPVNVGHLVKNIVLRNTGQIITGPVQMTSAEVQDLNADIINEVAMHKLFVGTAHKNGTQEIRCSLTFKSSLEVDKLKVNSVNNPDDTSQFLLFNGIDLMELEKNAVRIVGDMPVDGLKTYSSQPAFSNLVATGGLNGYYAEDFVLLSSNRTVQSYCSFSAGIKVISLEVLGRVHGEDLVILRDRYALDNADIKNIVFDDIIVKGDVNVPEVNNVIVNDLLRHEDTRQCINGSKYFEKGLVTEGDIWVDETFNDVDVDTLNFTVRVDEETVVPERMVFELSVSASDGLMLTGPASQLDEQALKNDLHYLENSLQQEANHLEMLSSSLADAFEDLLKEIPSLYPELSSVSYISSSDIGGVSHLQYNPIQKLVFATVENSDCLHEPTCACSSVVHILQIHEDCSLTLLESKKLGNFFVIMDPADANKYYDFTTNCNMTHTWTTMRTLMYAEENTVLTTHQMPWNGTATNILSFTEDITYFAILSQVYISNGSRELGVRSCIYIVGSTNDSAVEPRIYQTLEQEDKAVDIDMVTVGEKRWLLVTTYQSRGPQASEKANSTLYLWNRDTHMLEKQRLFPTDHATCGRLVPSNFMELEPFIVFGQMKDPPALHKHVKELEVLHFWNGTSVSSLQTAAWGINFMEVLNIDQETYLLLLSSLHDKISVFRLVLGDGFYKSLDFDFVNPLTAKVIFKDSITCLLVASSTSIISYQIHTKGISGNDILPEVEDLLNSSFTLG